MSAAVLAGAISKFATAAKLADALRERGNEAFTARKHADAVALYSEAIAAVPGDVKSWTNRALEYLKLEKPLDAFGDACHAATLEPTNVKARLRMAAAAEAMHLYAPALTAYGACMKLPLGAAEAAEVAARAAACAAAAEEHRKKAAKPVDVERGAHAGAVTAENALIMAARMVHWGHTQFRGAFRAYAGGPRDSRVVIDAFAPVPADMRSLYPLLEDNIKLVAVEGKGVGVVATKPISAKSVVYVDRPLLAVDLEDTCYHCLWPLSNVAKPVSCSGGCDRRYCSEACESLAAAWYHAPLCRQAGGKAVAVLEAEARRGISASSKFVLLAWKMLGWAVIESKRTGMPLVPPADLPPFAHLARLSDWRAADSGDITTQLSMPYSTIVVWQLLRSLLDPDLRDDPALAIGWVRDVNELLLANTIGIWAAGRSTVVTMGIAVGDVGSLFNHSCVPNVHYVTDMQKHHYDVFFMAARDIAEGEELTIAYCDDDAPRRDRQVQLQYQYGFTCTCPKCVAEA